MSDHGIVLIVIDSLRADRLSHYGAEWVVAPNIESMATEGILFEQAIAQGHATWTTMPTILSGCYPSMFGGFEYLSEDRPRLAGELKSLGYQTAGFAPNPYLAKARGYDVGFDHLDECVPALSNRSSSRRELVIRGFNRLFGRWGVGIECPPYLDAGAVTERAIRWLEQASGPFFLWLHFMDVHLPYNVQRCAVLLPGGRGQRPYPYGFWHSCLKRPRQITEADLALAKQIYEDGIAFVDAQVGRLRQALSQLGRLEQTVFAITADHGEEFYEHGLFGHQNHLYDESVHIPLITSPRAEAAPKFPRQVRHLDLAPTLIELAGGTPPPEMQGVSLMPFLQGEEWMTDLPAISQSHPKGEWRVSLRQPPWKLIWRVDPATLESHGVELYHLGDDPGERNNLSGHHQERVAAMQARLKEHIATLDLQAHSEPPVEAMDPEVLDRLRALGYVDDT
ncbi:MAG: sulfatase [Anaerolineae bacterium]|jgi:arylsulfatase A-like enzyme